MYSACRVSVSTKQPVPEREGVSGQTEEKTDSFGGQRDDGRNALDSTRTIPLVLLFSIKIEPPSGYLRSPKEVDGPTSIVTTDFYVERTTPPGHQVPCTVRDDPTIT